jgi:hypothetical protein
MSRRPPLLAIVAAGATAVVVVGLLAGPVLGRHPAVRTPRPGPSAVNNVRVDGDAPAGTIPVAEVAGVAVAFARAVSDLEPGRPGPSVNALRNLVTPELAAGLAAGPRWSPPGPPASTGRQRLVGLRTAVLPAATAPKRSPSARVLLVGRLVTEPASGTPGELAADVPIGWQLDLVATPAGWRVAGARP